MGLAEENPAEAQKIASKAAEKAKRRSASFSRTKTARGGAEHRWWQKRVQDYYEEKGYDSFIEHGEKSVDVYSVKENEEIATEIALSPKHEVENVKKCIEEGFDLIQILSISEKVEEKIKRKLKEEIGEIPESILFSKLSEYA